MKHSRHDLFDRHIFSCIHQIWLWRRAKLHLYCLVVKIKKNSEINGRSYLKKVERLALSVIFQNLNVIY